MAAKVKGCRRIIISQENLKLLGTKYSYNEYVRALAAARLGHADEAKAHIAKASADPTLAARAATEPDFKRIMQPAGNATTTNE